MIDLRSDVLTLPSDRVWAAMRAARIGWATFGEDPVVSQLESEVALILGKEAALFFPTCSMANLAALLALGQRGSQVVLGASAHIAISEAWGLVAFGGLVPSLLPDAATGALDPHAVKESIEHALERRLALTSVVCLENTHTASGGIALSVAATEEVAAVAHAFDAAIHLDGARLFYAAAALGETPARLAGPAETVSVSLNKGLGAPYGAILAGSAKVIAAARQERRRLGGGSVHQAGIFAAAGLVALREGLPGLLEHQLHARAIARGLDQLPGLCVLPGADHPERVMTNIVLVDLATTGWDAEAFLAELESRGVRGMRVSATRVRFVTHPGVNREAVEHVITTATIVADLLATRASSGTREKLPYVEH